MTAEDDERTPPDRLPDSLVERLETLDPSALRAVSEYAAELLEAHRPPLEEQIHEDAIGDVLAIEDRGIYTLVRMRSPAQGNSDADTQPVSLYHVTRERHPDGEEALHWSFLGDVRE